MNKQKYTHRDREHIGSCQVGVGLWAHVKKVKGLIIQIPSYKNSPGDIKYSIRNRVNNIVITLYGVRGVADLLR